MNEKETKEAKRSLIAEKKKDVYEEVDYKNQKLISNR